MPGLVQFIPGRVPRQKRCRGKKAAAFPSGQGERAATAAGPWASSGGYCGQQQEGRWLEPGGMRGTRPAGQPPHLRLEGAGSGAGAAAPVSGRAPGTAGRGVEGEGERAGVAAWRGLAGQRTRDGGAERGARILSSLSVKNKLQSARA